MGHLWDALSAAYAVLGFDAAAGGDEVFRALVLARIIEPTSKLDSLRVLARSVSRRRRIATLKRRLPVLRDGDDGGQALRRRAPRTPRWGRQVLVLYDVSTLYFETDTG